MQECEGEWGPSWYFVKNGVRESLCSWGRSDKGIGCTATRGGTRTRTRASCVRVDPRIEVRATRDFHIQSGIVAGVVPSVSGVSSMRDMLPTRRRYGRCAERDKSTRWRIRWQVTDRATPADGSWRPSVLSRDRSRHVASASAASHPRLERRRPRVGISTSSIRLTRVFRHPALLQTQLIRPGRGFDSTTLGRIADFPGPEEVIL